jgi:hypothetical protein
MVIGLRARGLDERLHELAIPARPRARPTGCGARRRRRRRRRRGARDVMAARPGPTARSDRRIQADDRARVDAGRSQQLVAIFLGRREGPLVRQNAGAGTEVLEAAAARRSRAGCESGRCPGRGTSARTRRCSADRPCGACRPPASRERPGRSPVSIVGFFARLDLRQIEPHRVGRVACQQCLLQLGPDHVVGRADDAIQVPDLLRVEAKRAKGSDLWHRGLLSSRLADRRRRAGPQLWRAGTFVGVKLDRTVTEPRRRVHV